MAAGHTDTDNKDGDTVFLETQCIQDCFWTEPVGGPRRIVFVTDDREFGDDMDVIYPLLSHG